MRNGGQRGDQSHADHRRALDAAEIRRTDDRERSLEEWGMLKASHIAGLRGLWMVVDERTGEVTGIDQLGNQVQKENAEALATELITAVDAIERLSGKR